VVLECTGLFTTKESSAHVKGGAKVIISPRA
jgi:glyceraldehyde-3-phosphate dehydrogenase/erythrose-4-phosphate dehydrogenase